MKIVSQDGNYFYVVGGGHGLTSLVIGSLKEGVSEWVKAIVVERVPITSLVARS